MTYKNLRIKQTEDGRWLAEVNVISPKKYNLQFMDVDEKVAREAIENYLNSQNATEEIETENTLDI